MSWRSLLHRIVRHHYCIHSLPHQKEISTSIIPSIQSISHIRFMQKGMLAQGTSRTIYVSQRFLQTICSSFLGIISSIMHLRAFHGIRLYRFRCCFFPSLPVLVSFFWHLRPRPRFYLTYCRTHKSQAPDISIKHPRPASVNSPHFHLAIAKSCASIALNHPPHHPLSAKDA
jgi:hypothetical protein